VHRVWQEAGLKPHRLERYMASDDPEFEAQASDILGLYLRPLQHAAVFCVDQNWNCRWISTHHRLTIPGRNPIIDQEPRSGTTIRNHDQEPPRDVNTSAIRTAGA
jgi:hypothetical protein